MLSRRKDTSWKKEGSAPDYRFSLANERTFLAWIRTSLGLLASAIALDQLAVNFAVDGIRSVLCIILTVMTILCSSYSYIRWKKNEIAMRHNQDLPYSRLLLVISIFMGLLSVILLGVFYFDLF
ncbi:DUF202 domain-containing protein [Vibrio sp. SS-MA-C1-2]|uniref:YidH family protein n=1 Tax=Vibrio sp. SS-MA-C1-2 TaxID=2908646 RepID=UPI001F310832|nr:DUF202 domain-containing protein [Vibrio sp. SS-MA-C1-2]UJF17714.1 DUF202 domain-containing protein [Vibrio sp. SS-MA-C1-2]